MTAVDTRFLELLEQHRGILYKVTNAYCREQDDRQDLAQEIALQLWRSYSRYDHQLRFSTWMYRIAMNVAISHYRTRRTRISETVPLDHSTERAAETERADAGDDTRVLYALITELDELNRALAVLYLEGYSHDEISGVLGLTPTNVATRVNRIKEQLRMNYLRRKP
jgi:RNA polymerase sigma factor (sigma-70 family)